jgi:hypothetical protein
MRRASLVTALLLLATAAPAAEDALACTSVASIGVATMTADGTITLRIRSLPPGPIAHGTFVYAPGDAQYESIKRHIGGIMPGEEKAIPPWCD